LLPVLLALVLLPFYDQNARSRGQHMAKLYQSVQKV